MEPLKEMFNEAWFKELASAAKRLHPAFKGGDFLKEVLQEHEQRSLNERMRHGAKVLGKYLPADRNQAFEMVKQLAATLPRGYTSLLFPEFVAINGKMDLKLSLNTLKYLTTFGSAEFAIREFLKVDFSRTISEMESWALDKDPHVRRLASEGCRPRLPWSFKLDQVIAEPHVTSGILGILKTDPELYVRKSVANHLNDISKDNPDFMLSLVKSWDLTNPHTAWIVKHACRSLVKKGHAKGLSVFAYEKDPKYKLLNFFLVKERFRLGSELDFSFELKSQKKQPQKLVVDYLIHYRKKNGQLSPKVFKLKDVILEPGTTMQFRKKQRMVDFTTRQHFAGLHKVQVQINGRVAATREFFLELR